MLVICNHCRWQGQYEETINGCFPNCYKKIDGLRITKLDFISKY